MTITITELPVKLWTTEYKEFLEDLVNSKENENYFSNYINLSDDQTINFALKIRDKDSFDKLKKLEEKSSTELK